MFFNFFNRQCDNDCDDYDRDCECGCDGDKPSCPYPPRPTQCCVGPTGPTGAPGPIGPRGYPGMNGVTGATEPTTNGKDCELDVTGKSPVFIFMRL